MCGGCFFCFVLFFSVWRGGRSVGVRTQLLASWQAAARQSRALARTLASSDRADKMGKINGCLKCLFVFSNVVFAVSTRPLSLVTSRPAARLLPPASKDGDVRGVEPHLLLSSSTRFLNFILVFRFHSNINQDCVMIARARKNRHRLERNASKWTRMAR